MFALYLLIACAIHANAHEGNGSARAVKDYVLGAEVHKVAPERRIFYLRRNGVNIDVKVVPSVKDESGGGKDDGDDEDDYFPEFPVKDIGRCIIEFSLGCIRKRFVRFLETVGRLDEITLLGQDVKLVRSRVARSDGRIAQRNDSDVSIERSVDDLFDSFALRITLPRWNSKREKNQIDVMLDETAVAEGRGKKGGGGKGKGGKCKIMMMGMLMMVKMKLMGLAAMKGIMMGGMSLMLSMMMLSQKFGKGGGGPWQSSGGGGQLKEIVLLTKSSGGGGGGGGCCGGGPSDSYSAPPPSSYGAPSGGGGGGNGGYNGGGGGWGRSFHRQSVTLSHNRAIKTETADGPDRVPTTGEVIMNAENIDYPDYQDYQELPTVAMSSSTVSNWNKTNDVAFQEHKASELNGNSGKNNDSKVESTVVAKGRSLVGDPSADVVGVIRKNVDPVSSEADVDREKNVLHSIHTNEWQATAEKTSSNNAALLNSNVRLESPRDPRVKDIPLLRGI